MNYQIFITPTAEQDLNEAADYIEFVLKNPAAADRLFDLAAEKIRTLADNPKLCPIINDDILRLREIRFITVKHYLAFYTIDEEAHFVYILRFLYEKRNWIAILGQALEDE